MPNLGYIKAACVSPRVTVASPSANLSAALPLIEKAAGDGCQIICLPELSLSAYTCGDLFANSTLIVECEKALADLIRKTKEKDCIIIAGLPVQSGYKLYNCAVVIQSGKILGVVPKNYIPEIGRAHV